MSEHTKIEDKHDEPPSLHQKEATDGTSTPNTNTAEEVVVEQRVRTDKRSSLVKRPVIAVAIVALAAVALLATWLLVMRPKSNAGRPVPAPRSVDFNSTVSNEPSGSSSAPNAEENTLTVTPEQLQRAGIKIETVGERLATATDGASAGAGAVGTGVVQSNAYRETPIVSLVGGIVRKVSVELGQNVKRGETLAVVFSEELAMSQSAYLKALAELDEHHNHHRRTAKLVGIGAASRAEFEEATSRLKSREAEVASLRQKLILLGLTPQRISGLRSSSQINSEVSVFAPASGTIINRSVNAGETIDARKELLRVADLSSIWVVGQVYEKDLGRIRVGSGASITSNAYPGRVFRGRISYVDPRLDPATRTAQVRIELANPNQMFKIGMYVDVAFATIGGSESTIAVVPTSAVQSIGNQQVLFVATDKPNVFALRQVRIGPAVNGYHTVSEGVHPGDRVVTNGSFLLRAEWFKQHPSGS